MASYYTTGGFPITYLHEAAINTGPGGFGRSTYLTGWSDPSANNYVYPSSQPPAYAYGWNNGMGGLTSYLSPVASPAVLGDNCIVSMSFWQQLYSTTIVEGFDFYTNTGSSGSKSRYRAKMSMTPTTFIMSLSYFDASGSESTIGSLTFGTGKSFMNLLVDGNTISLTCDYDYDSNGNPTPRPSSTIVFTGTIDRTNSSLVFLSGGNFNNGSDGNSGGITSISYANKYYITYSGLPTVLPRIFWKDFDKSLESPI